MRRPRTFFVVLLVVALPVAVSSALTAGAASSPTLRLWRAQAPPKAWVGFSGNAWGAGTRVDVFFDGRDIGDAFANGQGSFTGRVQVPRDAKPGSHVVSARARTSSKSARRALLVRENWPMDRGFRNARGANLTENVLGRSNVPQLVLKWRAEPTRAFTSVPTVVDGVVYASDIELSTLEGGFLHAVDAATGTARWDGGLADAASAGPTVAGARVYVWSDGGVLQAHDIATGRLLWSWEGEGGSGAPPIVANGRVYVIDSSDRIAALDATSGALVWRTAGAQCAGEEGLALAGTIIYVTGGPVRAFDAETGALRWSTSLPGEEACGGLAVVDGIVYAGTDQGRVHGLDGATGERIWTSEQAAPSPRGGLVAITQPPAVTPDAVFATNGDGLLYAFDRASGATRWSADVRLFKAAPVVANGVVYTTNADGTLIATDASSGARLAEHTLAETARSLAAPTVVNGTVYVSSSRGLQAFALP